MIQSLNRLFRLEHDEWPKLLQFGLFGFLLQMGMGIGFSAGDAAFLSNVGADSLPVVFMLTPVVMLGYTVAFSYLLVRTSIDNMVDVTLAALVAGGVTLWALIDADLPAEWDSTLYFVLKLYLAMWYIGLYSLFWNYTDTYFDIQSAKRMFPLFAAFCALGTASGAFLVSVLAASVPMHYFFLIWAGIALLTVPLTHLLRRRWRQIAESDTDLSDEAGGAGSQLAAVGRAFGRSRYTIVFTMTLFVTLLLTNLAEYQYSMVLQEGRSEAELGSLFGTLYAAASIFNLVTCLFIFNRLVARLGVRNVAFIQPLTYFAVFGYFFLQGGTGAAFAAFFAYHGVLTSIEYNNQNLLFNAVPSHVKRPLRTVVEGLCEPLASLVAGAFLLYAVQNVDMRELSGIGLLTGGVLIAAVVALRHLYPSAMAANMRQGWMNFGERRVHDASALAPEVQQLLAEQAANDSGSPAAVAARLLHADSAAPRVEEGSEDLHTLLALLERDGAKTRADVIAAIAARAGPEDIHVVGPLSRCLPNLEQDERRRIISSLGRICDSEAIPDILLATSELAPRERRAVAAMLAEIGATAIPRLINGLRDRTLPYRSRSVAARALAEISYAQFSSQVDRLVSEELRETGRLLAHARLLEQQADALGSMALLSRAERERVGASVDFVLELLAIDGRLPNFDLLIVSLHSANSKVRGNAIEAIESGSGSTLFRMLRPLLDPQGQGSGPVDEEEGDVLTVLDGALASGQPIEMALAADVLHELLDLPEFVLRAQAAIRPGMSPLLREHLLALMSLDESSAPRKVDVLIALARHPQLGGATLEALLAVAEKAVDQAPDEPAIVGTARGRPFWVPHRSLTDVAGRYPDLALVILRSQDERQYAA